MVLLKATSYSCSKCSIIKNATCWQKDPLCHGRGSGLSCNQDTCMQFLQGQHIARFCFTSGARRPAMTSG